MSSHISGARIRKELGRQIPSHRLSVSESGRYVQVEPDSLPEVAFVVSFGAREGIPMLPISQRTEHVSLNDWHIRVMFRRLRAITDYSADSGLVAVQTGARVQDLLDWLLDKGRTLPVLPDNTAQLELWEFLLSPSSGRIGPRFGCKWDQIMSLHAVLPNGKPFRNSLSPARATGPDFSKMILMGRGAFGWPLEVNMRVLPLPRRRILLSLAIDNLETAIERAWTVVREAAPEFIEIGLVPRPEESPLPSWVAFVELWGEGRTLSGRKELVLKHFGDAVHPVDVPYELLLGMKDTWQFGAGDTVQFYATRNALSGLAKVFLEEEKVEGSRVCIRGFVDNHVCVTADSSLAASCAGLSTRLTDVYASPAGLTILAAVRKALDPGGVMARVPLLWSNNREA